jgi:integral membrane protein (TIGR01906 family)
MNPILRRILGWYLIIITPILLVIGSTRLLMTPMWLNFEYTRAGFPADPYGFTTEDRQQYGIFGIEYLLNAEDIRFLAERTLPAEKCVEGIIEDGTCPMFSQTANKHMEDVKIVTQAAYAFGTLGGILALGIGYSLWRKDRYRLRLAVLRGSLLTLGLIVTIITLSVVAWDFFFDTFHALFFEDGTWQFYYSDTLIRLYPEQFWFDSAILVGIMTTLGAVVLLVVTGRHSTTKHDASA